VTSADLSSDTDQSVLIRPQVKAQLNRAAVLRVDTRMPLAVYVLWSQVGNVEGHSGMYGT